MTPTFTVTVRTVAEHDDIDVVVLSTSLSDPLILERESDAFAQLTAEHGTPLLVLTYTQPSQASIDLLADLGIPWATSPRHTFARMVDHLVEASGGAHEVSSRPAAFDGPPASSFVGQRLDMWSWRSPRRSGSCAPGAWRCPPVTSPRPPTTPPGFAAVGGPVAMKVVSIDLSHKSDLARRRARRRPRTRRRRVPRSRRASGTARRRCARGAHGGRGPRGHRRRAPRRDLRPAGHDRRGRDLRRAPRRRPLRAAPRRPHRRRRARSTTSASPPCSRVPAAGAAPTSTRSPTSSSGWRRSRRTATSPSSTSTPSPCTTRGEASPSSMRGWCCAGADERARGAGLACPYKA